MAEAVNITIVKDCKATDICTDGFILIYMKNDEVKVVGNIKMAALAPILAKIMLEKMKS